MNNKIKLNALAFTTIIFWSAAYPLTKVASQDFDCYTITAIRAVIAAVVMIIIGLATHMRKIFRLSHVLLFAIEGAFAFSLYVIVFNIGLQTLTTTTSSLIIATVPIFTAIGASKIFGEKLKPIGWISMGTAFAGVCILLLWDGDLSIGIGALWTFAAVLMFSAYNLINRKLENLGYNSMEIVTYALIFVAIELLPFAPRSIEQLAVAGAYSITAVVFMGIGTSALAYYTWAKALTYADKLNEVTNYLFLLPFITAILGWLMLAEIPGAGIYIGGAIIMLSLVVFSVKSR